MRFRLSHGLFKSSLIARAQVQCFRHRAGGRSFRVSFDWDVLDLCNDLGWPRHPISSSVIIPQWVSIAALPPKKLLSSSIEIETFFNFWRKIDLQLKRPVGERETVCVCVWQREGFVCVRVWERERARERQDEREIENARERMRMRKMSITMALSFSVCSWNDPSDHTKLKI